MKTAEIAMQRQMKSISQNYIQKIFNQVRQSTETYHLYVERDIASFGMRLSQDVQKIYAKVTERLETLRPDVLGSGEAQNSSQHAWGEGHSKRTVVSRVDPHLMPVVTISDAR